ncbi:RNA 2'-phosphotransferase [Frankia sp. Cr2]|uniref:RNA 2'-phosphotransferase n=1 Tax=Frankia sp. Cr2 TaxID=3073932 RepID=UPI002AD3AE84|nr:RNA 2'-phosphotransferase [Frankia sp. Cr2]
MNARRAERVSRYLSRHLRHAPDAIGIVLDTAGWTSVADLLDACARSGFPISRAELDEVVATSDKQRFAVDDTGRRIRANQGHSVQVELGLATTTPPEVLFHGTIGSFLPAIRREGLRPMGRHDVHLSADSDTAGRVGARRGQPVILTVDSGAMHQAGHRFQRSANGVWLASHVPPGFLNLLPAQR